MSPERAVQTFLVAALLKIILEITGHQVFKVSMQCSGCSSYRQISPSKTWMTESREPPFKWPKMIPAPSRQPSQSKGSGYLLLGKKKVPETIKEYSSRIQKTEFAVNLKLDAIYGPY